MSGVNETVPAPVSSNDSTRGGARNEPGSNPPPAQKAPPGKRRRVFIFLFVIVLIAGIAGLIYWLSVRGYESTDDAFIDGHIVQISPKVYGLVLHVFIDDNSRVKKGDKLVELDPRDYQAALVQAQGNYDSEQGKLEEAQAQVKIAQANIDESQAELAIAQANAQNAQEDLNRYQALDPRARSPQQLDNALASQRSTAAQVADAKAKIVASQAQLGEAEKAVHTAQGDFASAQGQLDQAKNNLGYCTIYAESDGVITRKDIEPGMYFQIDQPMFSIVQYDVWVIANYKETQLDHIFPGQLVDLTVDAYPGRHLSGTVQSIQNGTGSRFSLLPPENATGNYVKIVQRVPVKILLDAHQNDDMDHLLSPGMSVDPWIKVR
jgi:membrane fusion protein, multidrug efflux system